MASKITLRDVAAHLDLSPSLVSRVLNDKPGAWASEQTRARILEAAQSLDYRPSSSAQALATGRSMQIALLIETVPIADKIVASRPDVQGLLDAAARRGYRVILVPLQPGEAGTRQLENLAREKWCDGVCLFCQHLTAAHFAVLEKHDFPRVLIGNWSSAEAAPTNTAAARVDHDNYRSAFDAVTWLHRQGHERIAWALGPGDSDHPHMRELRRGYRDAMRQIGATEQILPFTDAPDWADTLSPQREFSAVIVRYLHGALSWFYAARQAGLKLPADLTILAQMEADQTEPLDLSGFAPSFAFHLFDSRRVGEHAGELLMNWAAGQSPDQHLILVPSQTPFWGADRS